MPIAIRFGAFLTSKPAVGMTRAKTRVKVEVLRSVRRRAAWNLNTQRTISRPINSDRLLDHTNRTGVPFCIEQARTAARTLRPLISTEMWRQINVFHRFILQIKVADLDGDRLSRVCASLKEGVQIHTGITEGTLYRDQGWQFYQLGRVIERADQTTRLLDIKYHLLIPRDREARRVTELTQWNAVLRGAAGYHAFKRVAGPNFATGDVVGFLLRNPSFPRSVLLSVRRLEAHLAACRS